MVGVAAVLAAMACSQAMARLALLIPDMRGGGAERVALTLIKGFVERGHEVDLVLLRATGELMPLVPAGVTVVDLDSTRFRNVIRPLARYLVERRPDSLQASLWPTTLVAILARMLARVRTRLLVSDHSNVSVQFRDQPVRLKLVGWSMRLLYPRADVRLCVSKDVALDLAAISGLRAGDFEVVYNPIEQEVGASTLAVEAQWTGKERRILNVGTLKEQKNQFLLLQAFALLHRRKPANLMILGEGHLRPMLEREIARLGIGDSVALPGFVIDPMPYYASADLFALSSDYEGFANVLVEAMSMGLPIVSTDCPNGPREVLDDGKYGRLVPVGNVEAMASALEESLLETPDRQRLVVRARQFRPEIAVERYLELMLP